jgi:hypothetical protein
MTMNGKPARKQVTKTHTEKVLMSSCTNADFMLLIAKGNKVNNSVMTTK